MLTSFSLKVTGYNVIYKFEPTIFKLNYIFYLVLLKYCLFDFQLSEETQEYILNLFQRYVDDGLNFINKKCHQAIPQVDISKVTTLCCLLESLILEKDRVNLTMVGRVFLLL